MRVGVVAEVGGEGQFLERVGPAGGLVFGCGSGGGVQAAVAVGFDEDEAVEGEVVGWGGGGEEEDEAEARYWATECWTWRGCEGGY